MNYRLRALLTTTCLFGCVAVPIKNPMTQAQFNLLQAGMTYQQVAAVAGQGRKTSEYSFQDFAKGGYERYTHVAWDLTFCSTPKTDADFIFVDDRLTYMPGCP